MTIQKGLARRIATDATPELLRQALRGIERIYRDGYRYNKAGVMLTALVPASQRQLDLYEDQNRERSNRLMRVLDASTPRWAPGRCGTRLRGM